MANDACSDTGPILHLKELDKTRSLKIFKKVAISPYVKEELLKYNVGELPKNAEVRPVNKDQTALLAQKYEIGIAEASAIWLCRSSGISVVLTDDLTAREASEELGLKPAGTIGIIARAFRDKTLSEKEATETLKALKEKSSLFVTSELFDKAIEEIKKFKRR